MGPGPGPIWSIPEIVPFATLDQFEFDIEKINWLSESGKKTNSE